MLTSGGLRVNTAILACAVALLVSGCGGQRTPSRAAQPAVQKPATAAQPTESVPATTPDTNVTTGQTADGHYFWGAPDAPVTMIDFSDFM